MAICTAESGCEKCLQQFPSERTTHNTAPEADQVQIVVLDALVRRKGIMDQAFGFLLLAAKAPQQRKKATARQDESKRTNSIRYSIARNEGNKGR